MKEAAGRMHWTGVKRCLILYCFLQVVRAQEIVCTVTQHGNQTTYNISGAAHVSDVELPQCHCSWSSPDRVLAFCTGNISAPVITHTIDSLRIVGCSSNITFERHCPSERVTFKVSCTCNCTEHRSLEQKTEVIPDNQPNWINVVAPVVTILVLVLVLAFCIYCYKNREYISRKCRHIYERVSVVDRNPDVEAEITSTDL